MKLEILCNDEGYIYINREEQQTYSYIKQFAINNEEVFENIVVYAVRNVGDIVSKENKFFEKNAVLNENKVDAFFCKHNTKIEYDTYNYLPSENWQELIECWSCHKNEFISVKELKYKVRKKGILLSSFFLLINSEDLPNCCMSITNRIQKIWFNELNNVNHKEKIHEYLTLFFKANNVFILQFNDKIYEMKYFYKCEGLLYNNKIYNNVFKIGIKERSNLSFKMNLEIINAFYMNMIFESILFLGFKILDYKIGFLYC